LGLRSPDPTRQTPNGFWCFFSKKNTFLSSLFSATTPSVRILFITATRLGDAVLSTGLLAYLLAAHPTARFTIAAGPIAAPLFTRMPRLDRILTVEKRRLDAHWLTLWAQTAATRWDLAVDLRGSALTLLLPARRRAIMRGGRRPGPRLAHLAGALNLSPPPLPTTWTAPQDDARAATLLPHGPPIIGLGPTANWPEKIWPAERFAALFHALAAHLPGARPAIFGGPGAQEAARAAPLLAALPAAIDLTGQLTLPEAAACLARCALFIGNDSGLMHLAAAAGTPTLGLFGRSRASEYAPAGPRTAIAIAPGPEGDAPMDGLTVEAALTAARSLIEG
jgi:ADP-heptose:LPS heptosyltransferase